MRGMQEIFDESARGLIAQGEPSFRNGKCYYRLETEDGRVLRCAIGQLVPDSMYVRRWDEHAAGLTVAALPSVLYHLNVSVAFLESLQAAHDIAAHDIAAALARGRECRWLEELRHRMRTVADVWGLSAAVLDEVPG